LKFLLLGMILSFSACAAVTHDAVPVRVREPVAVGLQAPDFLLEPLKNPCVDHVVFDKQSCLTKEGDTCLRVLLALMVGRIHTWESWAKTD